MPFSAVSAVTRTCKLRRSSFILASLRNLCGYLVVPETTLCINYSMLHLQHQHFRTYVNLKNISPRLEIKSDEVEEQKKERRSSFGLLSHPKRSDRNESVALFKEIIEERGNDSWSSEEWSDASKTLSSIMRGPWDGMCMQTMYGAKDINMGKSLMTYLESLSEPINRVTKTFFIGLLGVTSSGSLEQEDLTMEYYNNLISTCDLLDAASIEVLINGISNTRHYLECLKLLEMCKETHPPGHNMFISILKAALKYHNTEVCNLIFSDFEKEADPTQLTSYVVDVAKACLDADNESGLELVSKFAEKHRLLFRKEHLDQLIVQFKKHQPGQWTGSYGYIHPRGGNCTVCMHQMDHLHTSDGDFRALRDVFLDQVIVGSNIFFKSTPEELKTFTEFVDQNGPFDVVIDGLNVVFRGSGQPQSVRLENAIAYFTDARKKVLILGSMALKSHLKRLQGFNPKPWVYLTRTTKADDVFFLYAAIHSGKNTKIMSFDKLRDHKFKLDPKLRPIFGNWLMSAQIYDWFTARSGEFGIKSVHKVTLGPTRDAGGWHFPVDDRNQFTPFGNCGILCLRKKSVMPRIGRPRNQTKLFYQERDRDETEK